MGSLCNCWVILYTVRLFLCFLLLPCLRSYDSFGSNGNEHQYNFAKKPNFNVHSDETYHSTCVFYHKLASLINTTFQSGNE